LKDKEKQLTQEIHDLQAGGNAGSIHSTSTIEMVCQANICNLATNKSIDISAVVDSGCQHQLLLDPQDLIHLGFASPSRTDTTWFPDGSCAEVLVYGEVQVTMTLTDNSTCVAKLLASSITAFNDSIPGVEGSERIIGYNGLELLNLKLDFKGHKLIRRLPKRC